MKRQTPLLGEYLENISWRILEQYPQIIRDLIRRKSGVYALYRQGKLYYVGLAADLRGRIQAHLKDRHIRSWDRFSVYLTGDTGHTKELESLVLRIVAPKGNLVKGRFAGAVNLYRRVSRLMSDSDADRRASVLGGDSARRRRRSRAADAKGAAVLAGALEHRASLRARHHGSQFQATLRKDGRIRFRGKLYPSPSAAAHAVTHRPTNGWSFWSYREGRNWYRLDRLRR